MTTDQAPIILRAVDLAVTLDVDGKPTRVLDAISLELRAGEVVDVVGPSGAGKSTLLRALARLMPDASGELLLLPDLRGFDMPPPRWRLLVSLLPQKPAIVPGSVRSNLELPWRFKARREAAPGHADVLGFRDELDGVGLGDVDLDRDAARLSVGQQARVAFVRTLATSPRVLLLDEADASLDDDSARMVADRVASFAAERGPDDAPRAVIRVRHRANDGLATRKLRLEGGGLSEVPL